MSRRTRQTRNVVILSESESEEEIERSHKKNPTKTNIRGKTKAKAGRKAQRSTATSSSDETFMQKVAAGDSETSPAKSNSKASKASLGSDSEPQLPKKSKNVTKSTVKAKKSKANAEILSSSEDESFQKEHPRSDDVPSTSKTREATLTSGSEPDLFEKSKKATKSTIKAGSSKKIVVFSDSESPAKNPSKACSSSDSEPQVKKSKKGTKKTKTSKAKANILSCSEDESSKLEPAISEDVPSTSKPRKASSNSDSEPEPQKNETTDFNAMFEDLKSTSEVAESSPKPDSSIPAGSSESNSAPPTVSSSEAESIAINESIEVVESPSKTLQEKDKEKEKEDVTKTAELRVNEAAPSMPENDESKENIDENVNSESEKTISIAPVLRLVAIEKLLKPDVLLKQNEPQPSKQRKSAIRKSRRRKSIECIELSSSSSDEDQIDISSTTSKSNSSDSDEVIVKRSTATRNTRNNRQAQKSNGNAKSIISPNKIIKKCEKIKPLSVNLQKMPKNVNSFVKVYKVDASSTSEKQSVTISSQNFNSDSDDFEKLISMTTIEKQTETVADEVEPANGETSHKTKKPAKKKSEPEKKKKSVPEPEKKQRPTRATRNTCREPVARKYKEPSTSESDEEDEDSSPKNHKPSSRNAKAAKGKEKTVENREPIKPIKITKQMLESTSKENASSSENDDDSSKLSSPIELDSTKSNSEADDPKTLTKTKSSNGELNNTNNLQQNLPSESEDETKVSERNILSIPRSRDTVKNKFAKFREVQKKKLSEFAEEKKKSLKSSKSPENGTSKRRSQTGKRAKTSDEEMDVDPQSSPVTASTTRIDKNEETEKSDSCEKYEKSPSKPKNFTESTEPEVKLKKTDDKPQNEHKNDIEDLLVNYFIYKYLIFF